MAKNGGRISKTTKTTQKSQGSPQRGKKGDGQYDYQVDGNFDFVTQAPDAEAIRRKLVSLFKQEGFRERNFEISIARVGERPHKKLDAKEVI